MDPGLSSVGFRSALELAYGGCWRTLGILSAVPHRIQALSWQCIPPEKVSAHAAATKAPGDLPLWVESLSPPAAKTLPAAQQVRACSWPSYWPWRDSDRNKSGTPRQIQNPSHSKDRILPSVLRNRSA